MYNVIILNAFIDDAYNQENLNDTLDLCRAIDSNVVYVLSKKILRPSPATFVGKGCVENLKSLCELNNADTVIFNGELSPSQTINISDVVGVPVITRTNLILEVFARRALSNEGKILVELAQLRYIYPRLKGQGDSLSRQGGGIGSTGPGESKLEMDRRYIKTRIKGLERKLKEVQKRQKLQVYKREKSNVKTVAVVGYTNVGKSTLVNTLCGSDILELDQVFATLDLTARSTKIYDEKVIFIDTVGFIRELPETLMEAFKSTLEIAKYADLIVCVADASAEFKNQREVADEILNSIGANQNRLYILNKSDIPTRAFIDKDFITVSAKEKVGLTKLKDAVYERLFGQFTEYKLEINYESSPVLQKLKTLTMTANIEYLDDKIIVTGLVKRENVDKIKNII